MEKEKAKKTRKVKKERYHYVSCMYGIIKKDGAKATNSTSFLCSTEENETPAGIPTMGFMIKRCRKHAESCGDQYIDGSFFILSIIELTREQYAALNDTDEPED